MNHAIVTIAPARGAGIVSVTNVGGETAGEACSKAVSLVIQELFITKIPFNRNDSR
jgi:hypothetical protein